MLLSEHQGFATVAVTVVQISFLNLRTPGRDAYSPWAVLVATKPYTPSTAIHRTHPNTVNRMLSALGRDLGLGA